MLIRSEPADRTDVERESVEVGLVKLGVLENDDDDGSSPSPSVSKDVCIGAKAGMSVSSAPLGKRRPAPIESDIVLEPKGLREG